MVLCLAALSISACASRATPALTSDSPRIQQLQRELAALFTSADADRAQWAVQFSSLRNGQSLYSLNASRLMVPASGQKLLSAAFAADRLGWDFRFTTRIMSTAPIGSDGSIDGDVVVIGSGDPTINPRHPERWQALDAWAKALRAQGVRIVSGRLIADDNAFAEPGWGFGWSWDDLYYGYGAEPSALQYHENEVEVTVGPGLAAEARAIITTSPYGHGLVIDHAVTTAAAGAPTRVQIERRPGTSLLTVRGQIALDALPVTIDAAVDNPSLFFVTALREAFARNGIFVAGGVVDVDDLRAPLRQDTLHELLVDQSPPLSEVIDVALKWSRNIYAETLLLAVAPAPAAGSAALDLLRSTLERWGVPAESYIARDGSGLSRYNYVTMTAMTSLLSYLASSTTHAAPFRAALPLSGASGTLANRMKGTPAEGRVQAKTGTMSHVRSISGYATTLGGETIVFSMIANDFRVPAADIDRIMDQALERVVTFDGGPNPR